MSKLLHELPLVMGFATFVSLNLYLWTRELSQGILCAFAAILGVIFFSGMMWHAMREPPESGQREPFQKP